MLACLLACLCSHSRSASATMSCCDHGGVRSSFRATAVIVSSLIKSAGNRYVWETKTAGGAATVGAFRGAAGFLGAGGSSLGAAGSSFMVGGGSSSRIDGAVTRCGLPASIKSRSLQRWTPLGFFVALIDGFTKAIDFVRRRLAIFCGLVEFIDHKRGIGEPLLKLLKESA